METQVPLGIIIARISHITLANGLHMPQNITRCITIYSAYVSVLALVGHLFKKKAFKTWFRENVTFI